MKKILSLILALALVLSMTAIAGAEDVKDLPATKPCTLPDSSGAP